MSVRSLIILSLFACGLGIPSTSAQLRQDVDTTAGDQLVGEYFRMETQRLTEQAFDGIETLDDWLDRRDEYRRELFEMLGMDPLPARTPLQAQVTGQSGHEEIVVENLHFQSRPGLYVTANFYRPAEQTEPLPAILYVCGHGGVKKNGISYGNKATYQHHGAWFARNGYVCLTIDTIQLGEIEGIHHGTYREKMWWWNNRGYSSAAAEAWNCIRSLDYLQTRPEVDADRIGVTGRSGGGAYSWWIAALDERIKVAVPVAGITSLHNHVVDGCVEGHCDCMYMVNTYRWDYPLVAALVAPRPLLISNSDKDRIFPLDGVIDVHAKVREIYRLYDAEDKLGLQITEGPHKDTQELRVHAFRWFNRFLRDDDSLVEQTAVKLFEPEQLKVFDQLPSDEIVTTVHETFVPKVSPTDWPDTEAAQGKATARAIELLKEKSFRGWPAESDKIDLNVEVAIEGTLDGVRMRKVMYNSQSPYRLAMFVFDRPGQSLPDQSPVAVTFIDQEGWDQLMSASATEITDESGRAGDVVGSWQQHLKSDTGQTLAARVFIAPRGVGPTQWSRDQRKRTQIRRRFMQLGQTAATMQIWDLRRGLAALRKMPEFASRSFDIDAAGGAAVWTLYASLFEPQIGRLQLRDLPPLNRQAPDILNVSRIVEIPQLVAMVAAAVDSVSLTVDDQQQWVPLKTVDNVQIVGQGR